MSMKEQISDYVHKAVNTEQISDLIQAKIILY